MKDVVVGTRGYDRAEPGSPSLDLVDYLFDPLLCISEGSEESGPRR